MFIKDQHQQSAQKEENFDVEKLLNTEEYPKESDDTEMNELIIMMSKFQLPNQEKTFTPSFPNFTKKDLKKERRIEQKNFKKEFYDFILPEREYEIDHLVSLYNTIFPYAQITNVGFGKLKEVKEGFTTVRKRDKEGKFHTYYIKNS